MLFFLWQLHVCQISFDLCLLQNYSDDSSLKALATTVQTLLEGRRGDMYGTDNHKL